MADRIFIAVLSKTLLFSTTTNRQVNFFAVTGEVSSGNRFLNMVVDIAGERFVKLMSKLKLCP